MPTRMTPSQFRSRLQQIERQQRQQQQRAIDAINREIRSVNDHNRRVVNDYNRRARVHNQRLVDEINRVNRANSRPVTIRWTVRRQSSQALYQSFSDLDESGYDQISPGAARLVNLAGVEAANSAALYNAFTDPERMTDQPPSALQRTSITDELRQISEDLDSRWRGALFALSPNNPDAARQFCTSGRELFTAMLDHHAPDVAVKASKEDYIRTDRGDVSRRAKIVYCLERSGRASEEIAAFADADINDIIDLFSDFNPATHGEAGTYTLAQLVVLKDRAEHGIKFIHELTTGSDTGV